MKGNIMTKISRRKFLKTSLAVTAGTTLALNGCAPAIVPSRVLKKYSPSNRINVAAIGTGRISRVHDMKDVLTYDYARIMAVCDLDINRANDAKVLVNDFEFTGKSDH